MVKILFLLTRLLRGATRAYSLIVNEWFNFYSHASCEARHSASCIRVMNCDFYSHASCEARPYLSSAWIDEDKFLLTRLLRGATVARYIMKKHLGNFYSHASCEARLEKCGYDFFYEDFYSHASCEARRYWGSRIKTIEEFLLTRLLRGATKSTLKNCITYRISTHTPLARRDGAAEPPNRPHMRFLLTRLLRGATLLLPQLNLKLFYFYSHASCEARRTLILYLQGRHNFYSHASCEARRPLPLASAKFRDFYSHASCEARPFIPLTVADFSQFLLTRLLRGATPLRPADIMGAFISTHTPLARRDFA